MQSRERVKAECNGKGICAVSNVELYGYHTSGEHVKIECALTCLSGRRCWSGAVV